MSVGAGSNCSIPLSYAHLPSGEVTVAAYKPHDDTD